MGLRGAGAMKQSELVAAVKLSKRRRTKEKMTDASNNPKSKSKEIEMTANLRKL